MCPRDGLNVHRHRPESAVVDYRRKGFRRVFNVFTGTPWQGTRLSPGQILLILRGIAQGVPIAKLAGEYARDDDGDGVREVHCNTMEGIWTGLWNLLRPFRGVNKEYLEQYIIIFQWSYNLKAVTDVFLRCLLGCSVATEFVQRPGTGLKAPPALGGSAMVVRLTGRQIFAVNGTAPARHDRRAEPGHSTSETI